MQNLKEWADWIVETIKKINEDPPCDVKICGVMPYGIHIYKGIHKLANELGAEIKKESYITEDNNTRYHFIYKNTAFFQLENEEDELCAK